MAIRESHDVFVVRASPGIDALSIVSHCHDLVIGTHRIDDFGLKRISVLVLIDQSVTKSLVVVFFYLRSDLHEFEPIGQQVVIVDHLLLLLSFGIDFGKGLYLIHQLIVLGKVVDNGFLDGASRIACHADDGGEWARFGASLILEETLVDGFDRPFQNGFRFTRIENGEILG